MPFKVAPLELTDEAATVVTDGAVAGVEKVSTAPKEVPTRFPARAQK